MRKGLSKQDAMAESVRVNAFPVFLTSLTTAIGFLALNLSDVRPFNDLGNITTIGVIAAFIYSMVLLPALVALLPIPASTKTATTGSSLVAGLAEFVIARRRGLFWFGILAISFLSAMVGRNQLNDEMIKYFDESFALRTDTDFITENLSGVYTMGVLHGLGEGGGGFRSGFSAPSRSLCGLAPGSTRSAPRLDAERHVQASQQEHARG